jgi:hypothetical protein
MEAPYSILVEDLGNHQYMIVYGFLRAVAHKQMGAPLSLRISPTGRVVTLTNYIVDVRTRTISDLVGGGNETRNSSDTI